MSVPDLITSRKHPLIQDLLEIRDSRDSSKMVLEGPRLLDEAEKSGLMIETLVILPGADKNRTPYKAKRVITVSESVFKLLSDVETPQGLLGIVPKPVWDWSHLAARSPASLLVLDALQDPGNAASILRTAEAAGAAGVVTTPGTVRLYSQKALRGAAGATLRLPLLEHVCPADIVQRLGSLGYSFLAADGTADQAYTQIDWRKSWAVILGQEGAGLSDAWKGFEVGHFSIPMKSPVESLNVAAAAAIILYESCKSQSRFTFR